MWVTCAKNKHAKKNCPYKLIQAFFTLFNLNQTIYAHQCIHVKKSSLPHELS
jgi:hypothetical protein